MWISIGINTSCSQLSDDDETFRPTLREQALSRPTPSKQAPPRLTPRERAPSRPTPRDRALTWPRRRRPSLCNPMWGVFASLDNHERRSPWTKVDNSWVKGRRESRDVRPLQPLQALISNASNARKEHTLWYDPRQHQTMLGSRTSLRTATNGTVLPTPILILNNNPQCRNCGTNHGMAST
jgi:hypothetical protein